MHDPLPTQIGDLNAELDKLVAIANSWKDTGEERKRVTDEQASVIRGLMQVGTCRCLFVSLALALLAPCKRKRGCSVGGAMPHGPASCHCHAEFDWLACLPACLRLQRTTATQMKWIVQVGRAVRMIATWAMSECCPHASSCQDSCYLSPWACHALRLRHADMCIAPTLPACHHLPVRLKIILKNLKVRCRGRTLAGFAERFVSDHKLACNRLACTVLSARGCHHGELSHAHALCRSTAGRAPSSRPGTRTPRRCTTTGGGLVFVCLAVRAWAWAEPALRASQGRPGERAARIRLNARRPHPLTKGAWSSSESAVDAPCSGTAMLSGRHQPTTCMGMGLELHELCNVQWMHV